jgi:hypothetical protein
MNSNSFSPPKVKNQSNFHHSSHSKRRLVISTEETYSPYREMAIDKTCSRRYAHLEPLDPGHKRKRRSTILGKTQALQTLINNFWDNQSRTMKNGLNQTTLGIFVDEDLFMKTFEESCGLEAKAYQNDMKKNLAIEKIRVGNYRRKKMKSLQVFNNFS